MAHEVRALQSALDWAGQSATRALCAKVGAVYAVDKPLRSRGWLDLAMLGAQIMWHEDGGGLHYDVRPGPVIALAKSYNAGGLDLHLVPPGLPGPCVQTLLLKSQAMRLIQPTETRGPSAMPIGWGFGQGWERAVRRRIFDWQHRCLTVLEFCQHRGWVMSPQWRLLPQGWMRASWSCLQIRRGSAAVCGAIVMA